MATENCLSDSQINAVDNEKLVRPKVQLQTLLQQAGADKEIFTMKEVIFYLGQYIMSKQLYDKKQQHIVHCADDALGTVLGVDSFSIKEPRVLFAMVSKNLVAVKNEGPQSPFTDPSSQTEPDSASQETDSHLATPGRRRRRSSDPGTSTDEEHSHRKRHKSDSFSLTFDDSLSWCVISGLGKERRASESSESDGSLIFEDRVHMTTSCIGTTRNDLILSDSEDSGSDHFSVEFEVESVNSDAYSENDEASDASGVDEVYEVIFEAEDEDSFEEDTEISEADYWKCSKCEELNPPLPRLCQRCWTVRDHWLPESDAAGADHKALPPKPPVADAEEGLDVPDGKLAISPPSVEPKEEAAAAASGPQESCSQPSTSSASAGSSQEEAPELERFNSLEAYLPSSCLEPCVICQSRPKNGCIVHGRTGHLMSCYTCAKKLKNRNKLCPVCREPIQSVVLTYLS
uniref:E3 ubiquitin-protein ligase Mdm2 n=1 Tax=Paramormyrops kingsleyae TaxID=1676925 RepID=A0A3B3QKV9_9TELE|nr:E3 ubiquitin-protein ligase Mdm2 [Paramormyrops kingsleyae]XP_023681665.1 E3 ubiquitin-protein ligase Mdm2 [Paramormyrops kingsleyae]XP_023681671.1 E3 ubiquitin-protein ligase Mdm2 [Paramormyrops kingsleyae]